MRADIRTRITRALRGARGYTADELSGILGVPAPSVRRIIGELRNAGWLITTVGRFYRLEDVELS